MHNEDHVCRLFQSISVLKEVGVGGKIHIKNVLHMQF